MAKNMLIDAAHAEETRVAVLDGNRLEEFDFETAAKKQLKGNIYLAKVTRVEPSLQAAFVAYGNNRHGFLAFSEIHPDYYRIPISDREKLIAEEEAAHKESAEDTTEDTKDSGDAPAPEKSDSAPEGGEQVAELVEIVGGDGMEDEHRRRVELSRRYKIQEVIKRNQILLVQVTKEERGNKGAALTTYLSLAGRYCVLMPNSTRGGGVSRKITNPKDRQFLKDVLGDLDAPEGMSAIVRTAGLNRTKAEIKRDYEYLLRMWGEIRELTMKSTAPALIYEEANLIKRAIRDLYSRDIDKIIVEGEEGYKTAKDFMRTMMRSHAKKVQLYKDEKVPLFHRYQVEKEIDAIHNNMVQLKSGGTIVFDATEALVAIDVNSGKATRERNIEETALRTNLEAAEEVARQLRLRDLAGLIVIDFIDMENTRNRHAVERKLKDAMRLDRARIQVGRISHFGLLELSRQRIRPSIIESSTERCGHCGGSGHVRSTESAVLHVLRGIEDETIRHGGSAVTVHAPPAVALYLLNQKRSRLSEIEARHNSTITISVDETLIPPHYRLERGPGEGSPRNAQAAQTQDDIKQSRRGKSQNANRENGAAGEVKEAETDSLHADEEERSDAPRKKRRRGKRGGRRRRKSSQDGDEAISALNDQEAGDASDADGAAQDNEAKSTADENTAESTPKDSKAKDSEAKEAPAKKDGRRRRARKSRAKSETEGSASKSKADADTGDAMAETAPGEAGSADDGAEKKTPRRRASSANGHAPEAPENTAAKAETDQTEASRIETSKTDTPETAPSSPPPSSAEHPPQDEAPARKGWWQRA